MAKQNQQKSAPEVTETLNKQEAFFMNNKKVILIAVAAIIVIIAGIVLYKQFVSGPREEKASTAIAAAQDLFSNQQFEQALQGDSTHSAGFLKVASDFSGTKAGNLANYYAGLCYAKLGKWNEAVQYLEKYSDGGDVVVAPLSKMALGDAYANLKQLDKAIDLYKKAASIADSKAEGGVSHSVAPVALMKAATILESQNKKADALKIYQDIKQKYVNATISQQIDKYIERVSE